MKLCTKQRKRKITHPSVHLGYTSPRSLYTVSSPPPKKKKLVVRVFLGVPSSFQRPLPIESPMLRLEVPRLCVPENAFYQRFFSILIKVEQLSLPKRISEVTNVTFFAPPVSISIMLSNVLDVALPVTIRLTISLNERTSIRQSEVY